MRRRIVRLIREARSRTREINALLQSLQYYVKRSELGVRRMKRSPDISNESHKLERISI